MLLKLFKKKRKRKKQNATKKRKINFHVKSTFYSEGDVFEESKDEAIKRKNNTLSFLQREGSDTNTEKRRIRNLQKSITVC
jgi:hypothetical protein